jgi:hypothetical protein
MERVIWLLLGALFLGLLGYGLFSIIVADVAIGWIYLTLALGLLAWIVLG